MAAQCCKSIQEIIFEWMNDIFQFNKDFIKSYNEERDEGYFLHVDVQYLEKSHELHNDLSFLPD